MNCLPRTTAFSAALLIIAGCDSRTLVGRVPGESDGSTGGATPAGGSGGDGDNNGSGGTPNDATPDGLEGGSIDIAPPVDPPFTIPPSLVGTWTGYVEAYHFPSGSDAITLALSHTEGQPDRITVTMGAGPGTTPTTGDPWTVPTGQRFLTTGPGTVEGFPYPAHDVMWQGTRLVFQTSSTEPWQNWCAARNSYPDPANERYRCADDPNQSILNMCLNQEIMRQPVAPGCLADGICVVGTLCACDAAHCAAKFELTTTFDVTFDAPVSGELDMGSNLTFRLNRTASTDGGEADVSTDGGDDSAAADTADQ